MSGDEKDLVEAKVYITPSRPKDETEKSPLQSKKFVSYFLSDLLWKGIILGMVLAWQSGEISQASIIAAIIASAVTQISYVIVQGWIDKHVRCARIDKKEK
tara:strand:- start:7659 stop:7961 length:303 start_codon:yes stop_codon:yes gene_type:complete